MATLAARASDEQADEQELGQSQRTAPARDG